MENQGGAPEVVFNVMGIVRSCGGEAASPEMAGQGDCSKYPGMEERFCEGVCSISTPGLGTEESF